MIVTNSKPIAARRTTLAQARNFERLVLGEVVANVLIGGPSLELEANGL